ncbi:serine protease [Bifidobacterium italicum]|uniref:Serine protease n=2 Tax=Bifidobacterium italicum TaxID=1960968 RepID=A0A2A2EM78_9BIFI|nr:endo-alpha-N-acetylgalactosaminidase family protein [Bifidobacterium italicum]PAU70030.1 serine protease [Bifidobacterium italicum]
MTVSVDESFPSVIRYAMSDGKVMQGRSAPSRIVSINGHDVTLGPDDVSFTQSGAKADYVLKVKDAAASIDAILTVELEARGNALSFTVAKVVNNLDPNASVSEGGLRVDGENHPIETIAFPGNDLVSMRSDAADAQFTGALMSSDTNKPGDENLRITERTSMNNRDYMYAFVSGGGLSAGVWSNSEHNGRVVAAPVQGGSQNTRILANTTTADGAVSLGLNSAPWYWHRTVRDSKNRSYIVAQTDLPRMSVAIAADENADGKVDWQDGAIAFRGIMNNPFKSEEVPELVAWRIAMNFGSQAQNPFLTTLDNVKRVALNTDGLGQSVLLKGYGNEGHDSGHPDYADVNARAGGADDMNTLIKEGTGYGARFGVHVNASEMYPEAKAFDEESVRRDPSGALHYGWNWLDQGIGIDGIWDLGSGARQRRFAELGQQVHGMDFVYLDVWGNLTSSGSEDSWETRKMSKMINDNGWRMATEWGSGNEYDSTFQHWAADLTYGGSTAKGENSQVMRFLRNHQKDSWVGDYPSYGGAANAPLLGGYSMKDFEGWQGRSDYDEYIENLFAHDVSTKFLQHFKVTRWVNSPLDSTSVQDASVNGGNEFIELKDASGNTVTLSRGSNDGATAAYRDRTITLNGVVVASGAVPRGDNGQGGTESYLLPWLWNAETGERVAAADEKLYHWSTAGGTSEWTVPDDWRGLANVKVYRLTDQGRTDERTVVVTDGRISLDADAATPYVIYRGDAAPAPINVAWSTGMHVVDAGFNGGESSLASNWKPDTSRGGNASIAKDAHANPMLKLSGTASVRQPLTGLQPGQRYALYVGVDNPSNGRASMRVDHDGTALATNSTGRSIATNYVKAYAHNTNSATTNNGSRFQNMYVFFVAPESGETTLTLRHNGDGDAYFDDVRVVRSQYDGLRVDGHGETIRLSNNFENNAQGIWPFVVAGAEGVEDNRIHLSQLHAPYTQSGWDVKKMDDVLVGADPKSNWSVKVNGLSGRNALIYRTIPQNFTFEAGRRYRVSFDYQSGTDGIYAVAVGHGDYGSGKLSLTDLPKALGTDGHYEFELTGGVNDDSWFGVYSTGKAPDTQGTDGNAANFAGYKDFVLDNLVIERIDQKPRSEQDARDELARVSKAYGERQGDYSDEARRIYAITLAKAKALIDHDDADADDFTRAHDMLVELDEYMKQAPGNDSSDAKDIADDRYRVTVGSAQPDYGGYEGPAEYARDGKDSTYWHTAWGANAVHDGTAWYQFDLAKPTTVTGLRYLPRPGGDNANGKIKQYRITLVRADGTRTSIDGEFSTSTRWQRKSFDAVADVSSVRVEVLTSSGASADQGNRFASAAELRLTTDRDVPLTPIVADKSELADLVDAAKALREDDYANDGWQRLTDRRTHAESVLADKDATVDDVELAAANLHDAIAGLEKASAKADKTALRDGLVKAEALRQSDWSDASWATLAGAVSDGRRILDDEGATQAQVDDALNALDKAIHGLEGKTAAEPGTPGKDDGSVASLDALRKLIAKGAAMRTDSYTEPSVDALRRALRGAKAVAEANDPSSQQVDEAIKALQKAIDALQAIPATASDAESADGVTMAATGSATVAAAITFGLFTVFGLAMLAVRKPRRD